MRFEIHNPQAVLAGERWYWRARAANGRIVADGAEGYAKLGNAKRAVNRFISAVFDAELADSIEIVVLD